MLRALAQQLGRTCSSSCSAAAAAAQLEGPAALRQGLPSSTLGSLRWFSSQEDGGSETPSTAAPAGPSSSSKPSRLQTKEWRSWIDTKLDSKLEGARRSRVGQGGAPLACPTPPAACLRPVLPLPACLSAHLCPFHMCIQPAGAEQQKGSPEKAAAKPAAAAAAAAARPAKSAAAGKAGKPAAAKAPPAAKKLSGFELEQQIYNIVAPAGARPSEEAGSMPEGVTTYAQLAMASDAPRFARTASNVADISPHRLHPTRLFFPQQNYAPSVSSAAGSLASLPLTHCAGDMHLAWKSVSPPACQPASLFVHPQHVSPCPACHPPTYLPCVPPIATSPAGAGPLQDL